MPTIDCDGYHVLWTRPKILTNNTIVFSKPELVFWLTSIVLFKRNCGSIALITDQQGADFVQKHFPPGIYNAGIHIVLDDVLDLRSDIFWAGAKVLAHRYAPIEASYLDLDTILWRRPGDYNDSAVVALNHECPLASYYKDNQKAFNHFGFYRWPWYTAPLSCAYLKFNSAELKEFYLSTATSFMEAYTYRAEGIEYDKITNVNNAMVFAEQQILGMCANKLERRVGCLAVLDEFNSALKENPTVSHLWSHKQFYLRNPAAYTALFKFCQLVIPDDLQSHLSQLEALGSTDESLLGFHSRDDLVEFVKLEGEIDVIDPITYQHFQMTAPGVITKSCRFLPKPGTTYEIKQ